MKVKVSNLLTSFAAVFLISFSAQAQDELPILETQDPSHREFNLDEDKTLIYDHPSHSSTIKDSTLTILRQPAKTYKTDTHRNSVKEKEEEKALSFNFLYYMLQRFKMSDLIDQQ